MARAVCIRDSVFFWCPGCDSIHGVSKERWCVTGPPNHFTVSPSLLYDPSPPTARKRCHSVIREGRIQYLQDSNHALAGREVEIPDLATTLWADVVGDPWRL